MAESTLSYTGILKYVATANSSSWIADRAYQGQYTGTSGWRVGGIQFSGLRNAADWTKKEIIGITFTFTYANSGSNIVKTLSLYRGTRNSITGGTGASLKGALLGRFSSVVPAFNRTANYVFSETSSPDIFARLVDYISGSAPFDTFVSYISDGSFSGAYSTNYLSITAATLKLDIRDIGSNGILDKTETTVGETIELDIQPMEVAEGTTLTHKAVWTVGTDVTTHTLAADDFTDSFTVSSSNFTGQSTVAECCLQTYVNNVLQGEITYPFTVSVPDDWIPVIESFTVERALYNADDAIYVPSPLGEYVLVSYRFKHHKTSQNSITATISVEGDSSLNRTISLANVSSLTTVQTTDDHSVYSKVLFSGSAEYTFRLTLSSSHAQVDSSPYTIGKASCIMHYSKNGVAFGGFSTAAENDEKLECYYPAVFYNGISLGCDLGTGTYSKSVASSTSTATQLVSFPLGKKGIYLITINTQFASSSTSGMRWVLLRNSSNSNVAQHKCQASPSGTTQISLAWLVQTASDNETYNIAVMQNGTTMTISGSYRFFRIG